MVGRLGRVNVIPVWRAWPAGSAHHPTPRDGSAEARCWTPTA
jgi:hypothetical protein